MIFYLDENIPISIYKGLKELDLRNEIKYIPEVFYPGIKDEEWLDELKNQNAVIVTKDHNLKRIKHQYDLIKKYKIGLFIVKEPQKKGTPYWQLVEFIIKKWSEIVELAKIKTPAYIFLIKSKGKPENII